VVREPVEEEEAGRQQQDDGEDLPPERLPQPVDDDRPDAVQEASSPTASRYVSSRVDVSTCTP
jgi:hypothetical protein